MKHNHLLINMIKKQHFWTDFEIQYLKDNYTIHTVTYIADMLGRTERAVALKANFLNLQNPNLPKVSYKVYKLKNNSFDYIIAITPEKAIKIFTDNNNLRLKECDKLDAIFKVVFMQRQNRINKFYKLIN